MWIKPIAMRLAYMLLSTSFMVEVQEAFVHLYGLARDLILYNPCNLFALSRYSLGYSRKKPNLPFFNVSLS
ncbi:MULTISPECIES: hypothetical protein [Thermodesulfovibrio]|uniref:hypothetical protein n=1 Tax=Thermodesulfovibrio TaxID=28261 RepID=UPI0026224B2E|nr:hypothetical protein [Thermodesulfovibrio sp.]